MTDVNKGDVPRVIGIGEIGFGDTVSQCDSGCVIDETECVQTGDGSGIKHSPPLDVCVPSGNGDDNVGDTGLQFHRGNISDFAQVHGCQLNCSESGSFSEIVHLSRNISEISMIPI